MELFESMMLIPSSVTVAVTVTAVCVLVASLLKRKSVSDGQSAGLKTPPMIRSLPIVGSLPFLPDYSKLHEFFTKKAQTMGPVIGFYMGRQYTVAVMGKEALCDALVKKTDMASRPLFFSRSMFFNPHYKGIGEHPYDEEFIQHHKLILNILKDFGFGNRIMETRIRREVDQSVEHIRRLQGLEFYPDEIITSGILNTISSIVFNKRFDLGDPELKKIIELDHFFFNEYYEFMAVDAFKALLLLPLYQRRLGDNIKHRGEIRDWIAKAMQDAVRNKDDGESFVSCYLEREGKADYDYNEFLMIVRDLILAGTDTSSTFTQWFIIYMANHPEIQAKVQQEIDSVVGNDREISLDDEKNLPYTQATILELLRRQNVVAMSMPHFATKDTNVLGNFVPAGAMVIANFYSAHMDPITWPDPEKFIPERFLDSNGNIFGKERIVAFSFGKRSCIGEQLARQEIFLFCSSLAHHFQILPPEDLDRITVGEKVFLTTNPTEFNARLVPRIAKG